MTVTKEGGGSKVVTAGRASKAGHSVFIGLQRELGLRVSWKVLRRPQRALRFSERTGRALEGAVRVFEKAGRTSKGAGSVT